MVICKCSVSHESVHADLRKAVYASNRCLKFMEFFFSCFSILTLSLGNDVCKHYKVFVLTSLHHSVKQFDIINMNSFPSSYKCRAYLSTCLINMLSLSLSLSLIHMSVLFGPRPGGSVVSVSDS